MYVIMRYTDKHSADSNLHPRRASREFLTEHEAQKELDRIANVEFFRPVRTDSNTIECLLAVFKIVKH